ncbi:MAG: hypothetical protein E7469_07520 [Ruminococcaceae bacterium]|nr:hypothetical protein [Oscillospiraceae bacterium]
MTEKDLRKLSRADLLEMLIQQSEELRETREKLAAAEAAAEKKEMAINKAGSIAEASLQLTGIFEAAEASCQHYIENIRLLSQRQSAVCAQQERESREKAATMLAETARSCETMEADTKVRCAEMVAKAKLEAQTYWDEVSARLEEYYQQHNGLRELLQRTLQPVGRE